MIGADISAAAGWDIRAEAATVVVAVIDTGIRATHEDLAANLWTNPREIPGNGVDDDGNGYVDDVHGINSLAAPGSVAGGNPDDDVGHGSYVAGLIGAVGNNGRGISGVAWRIKIMALKFDDAGGSASVSNSIQCLDYAIANGARIINLSYGGARYSQAEYEALKRARESGAIVVTSAGNYSVNNDFLPSYPANYLIDNVVAVTATDRRDLLSTFSNYSAGVVDLAAPGTAILSTSNAGDSAYAVHDGTSFSSPLVAGALALLKAQFPGDTYRSLINRLLRSADPRPSLSGKVQTGARLNLARALASDSNRPFNDDFAARAILGGSNVRIRSNTQGATSEAGEPMHAGFLPEGTLWWSWTATASYSVAVETLGSDFDTVVAVYSGSSLAALTPVGAGDDVANGNTSRMVFDAVEGTTYQIAVGGKNGSTGFLLLTLGYLPANDRFEDAVALAGPSVKATGFNTMAESETAEPKATPGAAGRTVWYKWIAPTTGFYSFSIFSYGFDAVGAVYTGAGLDSLSPVDTASVRDYNEAAYFRTTVGTPYYFQVDGVDDATGIFDLTVVDAAAFPGYDPVNPSAAFNPVSGYLIGADTYGFLRGVNFRTGDIRYGELDGTLEVHTPAIAPNGYCYIGDEFGYLYGYDANFARRWRRDLGLVSVTSSPAIGADGAVYVHTDDGYLHAYFSDGTPKWRVSVPGESYSSPSIGGDGTIYIGSTDHHLYAVSPLDGSLKWKFRADGEIYASPAIDESGWLYFGTLGGTFYSITGGGVERWNYVAGGSISSSAALAVDGTVYFGCYDGHLYALSRAGALRWKYETEGEIRASSPAVDAAGTVYIGSYDGFVHAVTPNGIRKRVYATGAYIRASPLLYDSALFIGSGDTRLYVADIDALGNDSPWPMHRQNIRRTGRRAVGTTAAILDQPVSRTVTLGADATFDVNANGADTLSFQWELNGIPIPGAIRSRYALTNVSPAKVGVYTVRVTNSLGMVTSVPSVLGVNSTAKLIGTGTEFPDIFHAGTGFTYDQILLGGSFASVTADPGQILRLSLIDLDDDIIQVEFSGAGTLSIVLDGASGAALPQKYNQAVAYMKGHAGIVVAGANATTNLSVFSVGRANAANQALFRDDVTYDGVADLAFVAISSADGRFGGLRMANARFTASRGITGVYAPGVNFTGPVFVGDIDASGAAAPKFVLGAGTDVRVTGGDLLQTNRLPVEVGGILQLQFTPGSTSHGNLFQAQNNRAVLLQNGVDVTAQIVVNPSP